jgi:hypothetical protein
MAQGRHGDEVIDTKKASELALLKRPSRGFREVGSERDTLLPYGHNVLFGQASHSPFPPKEARAIGLSPRQQRDLPVPKCQCVMRLKDASLAVVCENRVMASPLRVQKDNGKWERSAPAGSQHGHGTGHPVIREHGEGRLLARPVGSGIH